MGSTMCDMPRVALPVLTRFHASYEVMPSGCWEWRRTIAGTKSRYGYFRPGTRQTDARVVAHRWGYEQLVGPIAQGLELDHTCRNSICVNPAHLEPVTQIENNRRARRTQCRHGHDLTIEANCRYDKLGRRRGCAICPVLRQRERSR